MRSNQGSIIIALLACSCTGTIGDSRDSNEIAKGGASSPAKVPPEVGVTQGLDGAGPYPLARLTRAEYVNTLRDLSDGLVKVNPDDLPTDAKGVSGFTSDVTLSQVEVDQLLGVAMASAQGLSQKLQSHYACDVSGGKEEACALDFAKRAGQLVYRRPLDDLRDVGAPRSVQERAHCARLRARGRAQGGHRDDADEPQLSLSVGARLRDREDRGQPRSLRRFRAASRLSYFLWKSMPDAELFRAATAGELSSADQLTAQAARLLADPKAGDAIDTFFSQWIGIANIAKAQKDITKFPASRRSSAQDLGRRDSAVRASRDVRRRCHAHHDAQGRLQLRERTCRAALRNPGGYRRLFRARHATAGARGALHAGKLSGEHRPTERHFSAAPGASDHGPRGVSSHRATPGQLDDHRAAARGRQADPRDLRATLHRSSVPRLPLLFGSDRVRVRELRCHRRPPHRGSRTAHRLVGQAA